VPEIVRTRRGSKSGAPLERDIVQAILADLGALHGLILWRNPVHKLETWDPESAKVLFLRAGLAIGSADLIGCLNGRFVALEVKKPKTGRESDEQTAWLASVRRVKGFAATVRTVEEARAAIDRARKGALE
jgi:hypothetical protein